MSTTADDRTGIALKLGMTAGQVVQEVGYDDYVDHEVREAIESATGQELVDEDYEGVADVVLLWFRSDGGDLTDALVDALTCLAGGGAIWLATPKSGRDGHIEPSDIGETAVTAGLAQSSSLSIGPDWTATRLAASKTTCGGSR